MISIQAYAFLTYQRHTITTRRVLIMKPILGQPNVIIIIKLPHPEDIRGTLELHSLASLLGAHS